ncbi:hypothetical protein ABBQ38_008902 [Trebouxia sp. C0009 RCD-2024]
MEPTKAPWAHPPAGAIDATPPAGLNSSSHAAAPMSALPTVAGPTSNLRATGKPVDLVVQALPKMPVPVDTKHAAQHFRPAERRITSQADLQKFLKSAALKDFMGFILALNEAAQGQPLSAQTTASSAINSMVNLLDTLNNWVDEIPPAKRALRYGNPAYREWFAKVHENAHSLLITVLPPELSQAAIELKPMLLDGFGNKTRIDYGTGHETTFCQLLYCLAKLGVFSEGDRLPLVSQVFAKYLTLMRKVQTTYWLEPAGSHGVWGLDDYQFLPFIWGSSQLNGHPSITPSSIHSQAVLDANAEDYLYLGCIKFVKQVNSGMVKMYQVEVLSKLPIMQHFLFGSLFLFGDEQA